MALGLRIVVDRQVWSSRFCLFVCLVFFFFFSVFCFLFFVVVVVVASRKMWVWFDFVGCCGLVCFLF